MLTIYGIPNCDTCRKARRWLEQNAIEHRFHDLRADGLDEATVKRWADALGWDAMLNRRSATWRQLKAADRDRLDAARAVALMLAHPTLVKRPVLETDNDVRIGFDADACRDLA